MKISLFFKQYFNLFTVILCILALAIPLTPIVLEISTLIEILYLIFIVIYLFRKNHKLLPNFVLGFALFVLILNIGYTRRICVDFNNISIINETNMALTLVFGIISSILLFSQLFSALKVKKCAEKIELRYSIPYTTEKLEIYDKKLKYKVIDENEYKELTEDLSDEVDYYFSMFQASRFLVLITKVILFTTIFSVIWGIIIQLNAKNNSLSKIVQNSLFYASRNAVISAVPAIIIIMFVGLLLYRENKNGKKKN